MHERDERVGSCETVSKKSARDRAQAQKEDREEGRKIEEGSEGSAAQKAQQTKQAQHRKLNSAQRNSSLGIARAFYNFQLITYSSRIFNAV
jgi:hypothetical protein